LQKPKLGDVSPRIESGVLSFSFYGYLQLCSTWSFNHLCWLCSSTFIFFLFVFPFHFLFEVFINLALLPIFFSLYPNPQKCQKAISFYHLVLRDPDYLQMIYLKREDLLEFSRKISYGRGM
jgi:hypothetical protein